MSNPSKSNSRYERVASEGPPAGTRHAKGGDSGLKINFSDILESIQQGKWIIIATFLLVTGTVAVFTLLTSPEYESHSIVYVDTQTSGTSPFSVGAGIEDRGLHNEIGILQYSYPLAERVATRILAILPDLNLQQPLPILAHFGDREPEADMLAWYLMAQTRFSLVSTNMNMVRITAVSESAEESALIANLYADEYTHRSRETSRASISATRDFLEDQEQRRREELDEIERDYEAFLRNRGITRVGSGGEHLVAQTANLDAMREQAVIESEMMRTQLRLLKEELDKIKPGLADRVASGMSNRLQVLQQRRAELQIEIDEYYARNPELRGNEQREPELARILERRLEYDQEISESSRRLVEDVVNSAGGMDPSEGGQSLARVATLNQQIIDLEIQLSATAARIQELDRSIANNETRLASIPGQSIELSQLERQRQAAVRMHSFLVDKLQETVIAEESELGYVEVIRNAGIPSSPVRPKTLENITLGMLLGLIFGLGLAFMRRAMSQHVFKPEDLEDAGYTLVGIIPNMDRAVRDAFNGQTKTAIEGRELDTKLFPLHDPWSPISEAYRYIRTNIQFSRPDKVIQSIMVTSTNPGEGKTLTAVNLAITMAQGGRRTLIIDADMRKPTAHNLLGGIRQPGLAELLEEGEGYAWGQFSTNIENLYFVPAGNVVDSPAEIMSSKKLRDFALRLREVFDVIIFDVPPVLPVADPVLLSTQCDGVILVAGAGKTDIRALNQTRHALENVGAYIMGTVLNRFEGKSGYGYGYGYGRGYGYGYGYGNKPVAAKSAGKKPKEKRSSEIKNN